MKSNLNIKILKLCISEICVQIGFDRISEQSLNILSDILKYYISQISLRLNKAVGSDIYFDESAEFLINFIGADSYHEKELFSFLKSQMALKKYFEGGNNKSVLHSLKILPNDQIFTGITRNNSNEIDPEPNIKTNSVNDAIDKDDEFNNFLKNCKPESFRKKKVGNPEYDFINIFRDQKKKKFCFDRTQFKYFTNTENPQGEIFNDLEDVFLDFTAIPKQKIFKNSE